MSRQTVALLANMAEPSAAELALQKRLQITLLPAAQSNAARPPFYLRLEPTGLVLYQGGGMHRQGLRVDLTAPALLRRAREPLKRQGLGRALGLKKTANPSVLDATAGFGNDAFLMASHGCEVIATERHPVVHELLADGLRRAADSGLAAVVAQIELRLADFTDFVCPEQGVDVVYLDPMFPATGKSARVKKSMAMLQALLGPEAEPAPLLQRALAMARKRVVVKRGRLSPELPGRPPDLALRGRSNRYDVYIQS